MISDDASVAFVLDSYIDSDDAQDVETLLSNMLKAIAMRCSIDIPNATLEILSEHAVKSLIVMGEVAANSLLGQQRAIDDWRSDQSSSPIYYQNLPVTVTYHPAFLLKNSAYKANAWLDLCAAKRILQSLSKQ
jgi:DNA polymerase